MKIRNGSGLSLELGEEMERRLTLAATRVTVCSKGHRHEVLPSVLHVTAMEGGALTYDALYGSAVDFCMTCDETLPESVPLEVGP